MTRDQKNIQTTMPIISKQTAAVKIKKKTNIIISGLNSAAAEFEILLTSASAKMKEVEQFMVRQGELWLCASCGRSSERKHVVVRHLRTIHAPSEKIRCEVCQEVYKNIETFKYHLRHTCHNNKQKLEMSPSKMSTLGGEQNLVKFEMQESGIPHDDDN